MSTPTMDNIAHENPMLATVNTNENLLMEQTEAGEKIHGISSKSKAYSNEYILVFTCAAFFLFVLAEIIGALLSGSLSLLGDAGAMSVDVFTYLCNIVAERLKARGEEMSVRTRFILEVVIPTFSIICLLGVTAYVTVDAVHVLISRAKGTPEIDVLYLYSFAAANGVVDILSSYVFFSGGRGREVFFTGTIQKRSDADSSESVDDSFHSDISNTVKSAETNSSTTSLTKSRRINLNMMSAFTHLTGDSMRTFSVIVAALVSTLAKVPSQICDAWAAVAVTITIIFMVIPLSIEIYKSYLRYR